MKTTKLRGNTSTENRLNNPFIINNNNNNNPFTKPNSINEQATDWQRRESPISSLQRLGSLLAQARENCSFFTVAISIQTTSINKITMYTTMLLDTKSPVTMI